MKTLSFAACLFLLIPGSAALSQPFPSFMLDSTIVHVPTFECVSYTSVACGPNCALIVWVADVETDGALYAARVSNDGALLDTTPIDIRGPDAAGYINMRPGVAWGGNRFLVVWTEVVDHQCHNYARCAIVREDGTVAQRCLLQDSINDAQCTSAAAAFDGTNFLALWTCHTADNKMNNYAYFARVSPLGVVLDDPPKHMAPPDSLEQGKLDVCFYGDRYVAISEVLNSTIRGVWGNFIMPDGTIPDSSGFLFSNSIGVDCPSVTHDRHNFIIAWYELHDKTRIARVSDNGEVLDSTGVLLDSSSSPDIDVLSIGDTTLIAYVSISSRNPDSLTLMAVRLDADLQRLDSAPIALSRVETRNTAGQGPASPSLARCDSGYFVAWHQPYRVGQLLRVHNANAYYRRLNSEGRLVDSVQMTASYGSNQQCCPSVASDGTDFLTAWIDTRRDSAGEHSTFFATRFSPDGTILKPNPIPIPRSDWTYPHIAYGGGCYLAVWWGDGDTALAVRISTDCMLMDTVPISLSGPDRLGYGLAMAAGDSTFLVAWSTTDLEIHGVRVTSTGAVLDSAPLLLQKSTSCWSFRPEVAYDGEYFFVTRYDQPPETRSPIVAPAAGINAVRVNSEGQVIDPGDIRIASAGSWNIDHELTFGDGVYLVTDNERCVSWRVSSEGVVLDSVAHPSSGYVQSCFDGSDFLLLCCRDSDGKIAGMCMSPEGILLDTTPTVLVDRQSSVRYHEAACAANDAGRIGLTFEDVEPAPWRTHRVRAAAFPTLGISSKHEFGQPVAFRVLPNPASGVASLPFNLAQAGPVQVAAFDATGRRRASLYSGRMNAGRQSLPLDTRRLANGVYFLRLEAGAARRSTRLVVSH